MVRLYIVRHGETVENRQKILQGHMQGKLTEVGCRQAREAGENLRHEHIDSIICSDLKRTIDTAYIINEYFNTPVYKTALLRERDWGELTGRSFVNIDTYDFPPSVESMKQLRERARIFLNGLLREHDGKNIIIVSHGVFSRCLIAVNAHTDIRNVPLMKNGQYRTIEISEPIQEDNYLQDSGATAE